jgi:aspartate aminotransferase
VLPTVKLAEERVIKKNLDKEYAGITGIPEFCKASINLALGEGNQWTSSGLVTYNLS